MLRKQLNPFLFFLSLSVILHGVFLLVDFPFDRVPEMPSHSVMHLTLIEKKTKPPVSKRNTKIRTTADKTSKVKKDRTRRRKKEVVVKPETIETKEKKIEISALDLMQRGVEIARRQKGTVSVPFFLTKRQQESFFKNPLHSENEETLQPYFSSYDNLYGETIVSFVLPFDTVVCTEVREPDPMQEFDAGSWMIFLSGCP